MSEGWETKKLIEVCENLDNKRVPITKNKRIAGKIPYYGASGIVDYVEGFLFNEDLLLISEDGANLLARTYPIAFPISGKTWVNNHAHVLRFKELTTQRFIEYYFNSIKLDDYISGMAQPKLNQKSLNSIQITIPPLEEQKQIVAILDKAFTAIDQAKANIEKNIENAKELFQSKLNAIFSQKGDGWEEKNLGEDCIISMGQSPKGTSYNSEGVGIPLINGPVEFGPEPFSKTIMSKWTTEPTKICEESDLILCVRGSTAGRINIAGFKACIGRGVASIRYPKNQKWINFFIRCNQKKIYDLGTGSTFPNVSGKILSNLMFSEPILIENQNQLIETMKKLESDINLINNKYEKKHSALEDLKKSILQKAFAGELTKNAVAV